MSSPLTITQHRNGDVQVLVLSGHIVAEEGTRTLREAVKAVVAAGTRACLLDLEDVSYVDSAGVGMLVEIYRHVTANGGQVKLLHPSLCARRVLGITHLTAVFDIFDSEAEAMLNLSGVPAGVARHV